MSSSTDSHRRKSRRRRKSGRRDTTPPMSGLRRVLPRPILRFWSMLFGPAIPVRAATFDDSDRGTEPDRSTGSTPTPSVQPRQEAASLIADALFKAETLIRASSGSVDSEAMAAVTSSLQSLGDRLEMSISSLAAERAHLVEQIAEARQLLEGLSQVAAELTAARSMVVAPAAAPDTGPVSTIVEIPPAIFAADTPLGLLVRGVVDFNLLVRLERILSGLPAVRSAGIESYQDGHARFIVNLDDDLRAEDVETSLASELGCVVTTDAALPDQGELHVSIGN